jgi:hypothetical protein
MVIFPAISHPSLLSDSGSVLKKSDMEGVPKKVGDSEDLCAAGGGGKDADDGDNEVGNTCLDMDDNEDGGNDEGGDNNDENLDDRVVGMEEKEEVGTAWVMDEATEKQTDDPGGELNAEKGGTAAEDIAGNADKGGTETKGLPPTGNVERLEWG